MSQKSTPRSPKSPRSKSPSCEDIDGQPGEQNLDELQRAVEEELRTSDRVLTEARNSIAGSKGRSAQSRGSYQHSPSKHSSRIPSPRATSAGEEEGGPRLPSPPASPVTYGSRVVTPGISERGSRVPSTEHSATKAGSRFQDVDPQDEHCSEEAGAIESPYSSPQRRGPGSRSTAPTSKMGSVTFGNKQSGVSYPSQGRYGNEMATSVAGLNAGVDINTSALRMNPSNADAATSCSKMGSCLHTPTSRRGSCPQTPTSRTDSLYVEDTPVGTDPSHIDATTSVIGPSYINATPSVIGPSYINATPSGMGSAVGATSVPLRASKDQSPKFSAGACSPGCRKFMKEIEESKPLTSTPIKNKPPKYSDGPHSPGCRKFMREIEEFNPLTSTPIKNKPPKYSDGPYSPGCRKFMREIEEFNPLTSTPIKNKPPKYSDGPHSPGCRKFMREIEEFNPLTSTPIKNKPPKYSDGPYSPGCRKFMREIEEFKPLTSTPIKGAQMYSDQNQSTFIYDKPISPCPRAGGRRPSPPASVANQQIGQVEFAYYEQPSYQGNQAAPKFERSLSPHGARFPQSGDEHHHHHFDDGYERPSGRDETVVAALSHLSQLNKSPSYYRCGLNQGGTDFLKVCNPKGKEGSKKGPAKLPEIPCLREDELDDLIKCEIQDVDSTWYIMSDERKTYKKPCPKQQKAQMTVKALMQTHAGQTCSQKEYSPLEHPDPEDLSPELAAAMMFSQERGLKMEECPNDTITSLFPDEPKAPFPEKIPANSISIVDRSAKDQEEMIEKSASVPSEGVSDSAYTRTMKGKGEEIGAQKSFDVDFAIGQSKREYILVAQKPQRVNKVQYRGNTPPWFPGFLSAFPDDDRLKIVNSPSGLFHKAWVHSNPGNMPTSDVIVLD